LAPNVLDVMSADDKAAWQFIVAKESVSSSELVVQLGFDERRVQRILKKLMDANLLRRVGKGRATRYEGKR
jgi:predicted transcriptional regulator